MSNLTRLAALLSFALASSTSAEPPSARTIDLDAPGALALMKHDNPGHFARVQGVLANLCEVPEQEVPATVGARFAARDVAWSPTALLTTDPPKTRLSFRLDQVRYSAVLTLQYSDSRYHPVYCPKLRADPSFSVEVVR